MALAASVPLSACAPNAPSATARKQSAAAIRKSSEFTREAAPRFGKPQPLGNSCRQLWKRAIVKTSRRSCEYPFSHPHDQRFKVLRLLVLLARLPHLIRHFLRVIEGVLRPIMFIYRSWRGRCGSARRRRFAFGRGIAAAVPLPDKERGDTHHQEKKHFHTLKGEQPTGQLNGPKARPELPGVRPRTQTRVIF